MKKTAVILALCLAALSGCGRVDSVDVDSNVVPFEIATTPTTEADTEETTEPKSTVTTAPKSTSRESSTTRTGSVSFVKRTGLSSVPKRTASQTQATKAPAPKRTAPPATAAVTTAVYVTTIAGTDTTTAATAAETTAVSTDVVTSAVTDVSTTDTAVVTTVTQPADDPAVVTNNDLSCHVTENCIEITYKGEPVQNLYVDTTYLLESYKNGIADSSSLVSIVDFDFDGHYDIFVPSSKDDFNVYGTYYRYMPSTDTFELWGELTNIGHSVTVDTEYDTLTVTTQTNDIEYERKIYQWVTVDEDTVTKSLSLMSRIKQFRMDDSPENEYEIYIDYYDYSDGNEELIKREKHIYDENNQFLGVEEVDIEWLLNN